MLDMLVKKSVSYFIRNNIIHAEEREIYEFGLESVLFTVINLSAIFFIGLILHLFWETAAYIAAFFFLRKYAGGYHAGTRFKCFLTSVCVYFLSVAASRFIIGQASFLFILGSCLITVLVVFIFAPIDHENRPFSQDEYVNFKNKSRISVLVLSMAAVFGFLFFNSAGTIFVFVSFGLLTMALSLTAAKFIKKR